MTTDQQDGLKFQVEADGQVYDIDLTDFDGHEWSEIKRVTAGMTPARLFQACAELDFEAIASLIWTHKKRASARASYEKVLKTLKLSNTRFIPYDDGADDADGEEGDGDGEPSPPPPRPASGDS